MLIPAHNSSMSRAATCPVFTERVGTIPTDSLGIFWGIRRRVDSWSFAFAGATSHQDGD